MPDVRSGLGVARMRSVARLEVRVADRERGRVQVVLREHVVELDGLVLEAQHEHDDGSTLVWLTEDCPYDETLHVYLLGRDGEVRDAIEAGARAGLGAAGILELGRVGDDGIEFAFFRNGVTYRLEVADEPRVRRPLPSGWRYKRALSRHRLLLHEQRTEST